MMGKCYPPARYFQPSVCIFPLRPCFCVAYRHQINNKTTNPPQPSPKYHPSVILTAVHTQRTPQTSGLRPRGHIASSSATTPPSEQSKNDETKKLKRATRPIQRKRQNIHLNLLHISVRDAGISSSSYRYLAALPVSLISICCYTPFKLALVPVPLV